MCSMNVNRGKFRFANSFIGIVVSHKGWTLNNDFSSTLINLTEKEIKKPFESIVILRCTRNLFLRFNENTFFSSLFYFNEPRDVVIVRMLTHSAYLFIRAVAMADTLRFVASERTGERKRKKREIC